MKKNEKSIDFCLLCIRYIWRSLNKQVKKNAQIKEKSPMGFTSIGNVRVNLICKWQKPKQLHYNVKRL